MLSIFYSSEIFYLPSQNDDFNRKFATQDGTRYFWEARFITTTFDASPDCLIYINRMLQNEDGYIRVFTKKLDSGLDKVTTATYKNPYFEKPANVKPRNY